MDVSIKDGKGTITFSDQESEMQADKYNVCFYDDMQVEEIANGYLISGGTFTTFNEDGHERIDEPQIKNVYVKYLDPVEVAKTVGEYLKSVMK